MIHPSVCVWMCLWVWVCRWMWVCSYVHVCLHAWGHELLVPFITIMLSQETKGVN